MYITPLIVKRQEKLSVRSRQKNMYKNHYNTSNIFN